MINIQQDTADISGVEQLLNKNGDINLTLDIDEIEKDINILMEKEPISRVDKKNINSVIAYLDNLIKRADGNNILLTWIMEDGLLKSYPVEFIHIPEYNIEMTDYIHINNGYLVRVDYKNVYNIIALDMIYRDLGESMESMETKLDNLGITGIYPDSELLKYFDENIYELSKQLKISDSPYASKDKKNNIEYFGRKRFDGKYYRDMVEYSIKHALTIITKSILFKLSGFNIDFKLFSISDSGVYFITTYEDKKLVESTVSESIVVRAFGRKFEVKPRITMF